MRGVQAFIGLVVVLFGAWLRVLTAGIASLLSPIDVAAVALIVSGFLFWVPGMAWRRYAPWLAFPFVPGACTFAVSAILMYTARGAAAAFVREVDRWKTPGR
jgi:hypothetical protein